MKTTTSFAALFLGIFYLVAVTACSEKANVPTGFQIKLKGGYVPLFSDEGINAKKWDQLWLTETARLVGEANAQATVEKLKGSMAGDVIGEEAVAKYGAYPNSSKDLSKPFKFDCGFKQGVAKLKFDGSSIQGMGAEGKVIFSHTYSYIGYDKDLDTYEYKSDDGNNDEFSFFVFRPDTPSGTHHIEFRYGNDVDELLKTPHGKICLLDGCRHT